MPDRPFGSPPSSTFEVRPTADDVASFRENGFLVVERITTDEELAWITRIFESLFDREGARTFEPGREHDQSGPSRLDQLIAPELEFPELLATTYRRNALHFAAALLEVPEAELVTWSHMIRKPPRLSRVAPWHQDEAYWQPELDYHAVGAWLPLHDVTVERGCMQFIPGSHRGPLLLHRHVGDPAGNLLVAEEVEPARAVPCPLPAGGATFHHHRTLHHTAANTTDLPRLAFPMEFQLPPTLRREPRETPWVDAFRDATGHPTGPPTYIADGTFVLVTP